MQANKIINLTNQLKIELTNDFIGKVDKSCFSAFQDTSSEKSKILSFQANISPANKRKRGKQKIKKSFECDKCEKTFLNKSSFNVHNRKHSDYRPYECTQCAKKFTQLGNLNYHLKIHNGEKTRTYKQYEKTFTRSISLKVQELTKHAEIQIKNQFEIASGTISVQ